jgi:hypothetical protein
MTNNGSDTNTATGPYVSDNILNPGEASVAGAGLVHRFNGDDRASTMSAHKELP